jgi:predicted signal transduction protein with EAL and GGDEF domain
MMSLIHTTVASIIDTSGLPNPNTANTENDIVTLVFQISASIAVLMVVVGGFRYIIARGDPNATASARNTILYAIVGLVVVMAAYSIVTFVVKGII